MFGYTMTCVCGATSSVESCLVREGRPLPAGHFYCPACDQVFARKANGWQCLGRREDGTLAWVPKKIDIVPVELPARPRLLPGI